jgi:hypothetical protein
VLLVAWRDGVALGCSGFRLLGHGTGDQAGVRPAAGTPPWGRLGTAARARGRRAATRCDHAAARHPPRLGGRGRPTPRTATARFPPSTTRPTRSTGSPRRWGRTGDAPRAESSFGRCNGAGFPCDREGDERTTPCPPHRRPSSDP